MFVTTSNFEQRIPAGLALPDSRYWLAVILSSEAPWFLVSYRVREGDASFVQTVAVAWESTLSEFITTVGAEQLVSVRWVVPDCEKAGQWSMKEVAELWAPTDGEIADTGPLLCRVAGEQELVDSFQGRVARSAAGRRLLARLSASQTGV